MRIGQTPHYILPRLGGEMLVQVVEPPLRLLHAPIAGFNPSQHVFKRSNLVIGAPEPRPHNTHQRSQEPTRFSGPISTPKSLTPSSLQQIGEILLAQADTDLGKPLSAALWFIRHFVEATKEKCVLGNYLTISDDRRRLAVMAVIVNSVIERRRELVGFPGLLSAVAEETGFSLSYVSRVWNGSRRCDAITKAIAREMARRENARKGRS